MDLANKKQNTAILPQKKRPGQLIYYHSCELGMKCDIA